MDDLNCYEENRQSVVDALKEILKGDFAVATTPVVQVLAWPSVEEHRCGYIALYHTVNDVDHCSGTAPHPAEVALEAMADHIAMEIMTGARSGNADLEFKGRAATKTRNPIPGRSQLKKQALRLIQDFAQQINQAAVSAVLELENHSPADSFKNYDYFRRLQPPYDELIRDWPWTVRYAFKNDTYPIPLKPHPGESAIKFATRLFLTANEEETSKATPSLSKAMNHLRGYQPDANTEWQLSETLLALAEMPPEWVPPKLTDDTWPDWEQAIHLGYETYLVTRLTGQSPRSLIKKFPGSWPDLVNQILYSANLDVEEDPVFHFTGHCADMLSSFENQVVRPALLRIGIVPDSDGGSHGDETLSQGDHRQLRRSVLKLLFRDKGWIAIAELTVAWQIKSIELGTLEASLAHADDTQWPDLLTPWFMPISETEKVEIRCLSSAQAFLDEGANGPDQSGIGGLNHCIPSFMNICAKGRGIALSIRLHTSGQVQRLSTAYIETNYTPKTNNRSYSLNVDQHYGHSNSPPATAASKALKKYLAELDPDDVEDLLHNRRQQHANTDRPSAYNPHQPGSVESMLKAWAFALSRDTRKLSPGALLVQMGLPEDLDLKLPPI